MILYNFYLCVLPFFGRFGRASEADIDVPWLKCKRGWTVSLKFVYPVNVHANIFIMRRYAANFLCRKSAEHAYLRSNVGVLDLLTFTAGNLTGQFLKTYSLKFDEIMSISHFSPWTPKNKFWTKDICDTIKFLMKAIFFKNFKNCFSFHSLGPF